MKKHRIIYLLLILLALVCLIVSFLLGMNIGMSLPIEHYRDVIIPELSMVGTWIAAFGTISAVVVSLWLAFRQIAQNKEILDCHLETMVMPPEVHKAFIGVKIVSRGDKPANIVSVSWFGDGAKTAMWVAKFHILSDRLPKTLSYGEQLNLLHVEGFEDHLRKYVIDELGGQFEKLYLAVSTTTASTKIRPSSSLLQFIRDSKTAQGTNPPPESLSSIG